MAAGLVVVHLTKRLLNCIPVINIVTRPILDLFPSYLLGPALGAAAMYGMERGDLLAARHVVREKAQSVRQEFETVLQDVASGVGPPRMDPSLARQLDRSSQAFLDTTARAATQAVSELERTVLPVLEREYRSMEPQVRRAWQDVSGGGGGGHR